MISQTISCAEHTPPVTGEGPAPSRKNRTGKRDVHTLADIQDKLETAERSRARLKSSNERLKKENSRLVRELAERSDRIEELLQQASQGVSHAAALEQENTSLLHELENCLQQIEQLDAAREQDLVRMDEQEERLRLLEPRDNCGAFLDTDGCDIGCPAYVGCQRRVLIVGGIERMESRYRQLVEKEGGVLDYHPGNMQGGVKKLERCLQRADIILCPVNCNSHGACLMVKKLGKKHNKPVHMMANFSLHAITQAIGSAASA